MLILLFIWQFFLNISYYLFKKNHYNHWNFSLFLDHLRSMGLWFPGAFCLSIPKFSSHSLVSLKAFPDKPYQSAGFSPLFVPSPVSENKERCLLIQERCSLHFILPFMLFTIGFPISICLLVRFNFQVSILSQCFPQQGPTTSLLSYGHDLQVFCYVRSEQVGSLSTILRVVTAWWFSYDTKCHPHVLYSDGMLYSKPFWFKWI